MYDKYVVCYYWPGIFVTVYTLFHIIVERYHLLSLQLYMPTFSSTISAACICIYAPR
jgi:hypothetical protein